MRWGRGESDSKQKDRQDKRRRDNGETQSEGTDNRRQEITQEIQQIIRDELKMIVNGGELGQRPARTAGSSRFRIKRPIRVGGRGASQGGHQRVPEDPAIRHDIELLTQVQMELSEELAENLKQLKAVISESQALAKRIQAVLGQSSGDKS